MQLNLKNHRANIFEKNPFDVNKTSIVFVPGAGMDHRIISMFEFLFIEFVAMPGYHYQTPQFMHSALYL